MVGKAGLTAHQAVLAQGDRSRQSNLGSDARACPDPAVVAHLDLGVQTASRPDRGGIQQPGGEIALGPDPHVLVQVHTGEVREGSVSANPSDQSEALRSQDGQGSDMTISVKYGPSVQHASRIDATARADRHAGFDHASGGEEAIRSDKACRAYVGAAGTRTKARHDLFLGEPVWREGAKGARAGQQGMQGQARGGVQEQGAA